MTQPRLIDIRARMLEIARRRGLTHLGSCCSALPILYDIYRRAGPNDVIILSAGHSGLALYCCLEAFRGQDAEDLYDRMGTHPERDEAAGIFCTTGSLGCGLAVAVGYAMARRKTHVVVTDGECAEGIVWECLAFLGKRGYGHEWPITIHVNANGWSAYQRVDVEDLAHRLRAFCPPMTNYIVIHRTRNAPLPETLEAHYMRMEPEPCDALSPMNC